MSSPEANLSNLKQLSSSALNTIYNSKLLNTWILTFLQNPTVQNYNNMETAIKSVFTTLNCSASVGVGLRFLITSSDGRVVYDTTKANNVNTHANYIAPEQSIGENHSSRPEIMQALLSTSGIGICKRYSNTASDLLFYLATRLGSGPDSPEGIFRINLKIS
jgi:hypothetical protein